MSHPAPRLLVIGTETAEQREARRASSGGSSAESFAATLRQMVPGAKVAERTVVDDDTPLPEPERFDAVFFAGSPILMHEDTVATRRARRAMERLLLGDRPVFGSCAGLHIAVVAAGGNVRPGGDRLEAAFARRILRTREGLHHPLLEGRPVSFEAPAMHSAEVDRLPENATVLAYNDEDRVQAVEIRSGRCTVWAVQYHPELSLGEIAVSLRRQADDLLRLGFARDRAALDAYAASVRALADDPARRDLHWQLGVDREVADTDRRRLEIANFIARFVARGASSGRHAGTRDLVAEPGNH